MSHPQPTTGAYLIFGPPGSGKSTIAHRLRDLGYNAIDADRDTKLAEWVNTATDHRLESRPGFPLTQTFLDHHRWRWEPQRLGGLLRDTSKHPLFLCGDADNVEDFFPQFRLRFALQIPTDKMVQRLKHRDPKRWNDANPELGDTVNYNETFQALCALGWKDQVIPIPAFQPTQDIVDQILQATA